MSVKYIDADALKARVHERTIRCHAGDIIEACYMVCEQLIDEADAADVAPVARGTWEQPGTQGAEESIWCSVCGAGPHLYPWRYCPDCGARMDAKE